MGCSSRLKSVHLQKCMQTEVAFLGHIVGRTGLACDPAKISAVQVWHAPSSVKQVRQREVVIAYASRSLRLSQRCYCTTRREMLVAVTMCTHFRSYLQGAQFTLRTDHRSLWWLQKSETLWRLLMIKSAAMPIRQFGDRNACTTNELSNACLPLVTGL